MNFWNILCPFESIESQIFESNEFRTNSNLTPPLSHTWNTVEKTFLLPGFENLDKPKLTGLRYGLMEIVHKQVCKSKIKGPLQHVLPEHTFCVTRYEGELWFDRVYA